MCELFVFKNIFKPFYCTQPLNHKILLRCQIMVVIMVTSRPFRTVANKVCSMHRWDTLVKIMDKCADPTKRANILSK